ncbi:hypothetical protein [Clostridium tertium]|nr:hypothetical protein [Clostridium tertium]MBP1867587.1 hypothetical protein [Clostridium tertium]
MKMKKCLGSLMLLLSAVLINVGPTSVMSVGVEEMPDSIKKLR